MAAAVIVLLAVESVALLDPSGGDTISEVFWGLAARLPLVPFLLGLICGHLVWPPQKCNKCGEKPWA
jgi:hypothetical protein